MRTWWSTRVGQVEWSRCAGRLDDPERLRHARPTQRPSWVTPTQWHKLVARVRQHKWDRRSERARQSRKARWPRRARRPRRTWRSRWVWRPEWVQRSKRARQLGRVCWPRRIRWPEQALRPEWAWRPRMSNDLDRTYYPE